jgi:hypothetical protein
MLKSLLLTAIAAIGIGLSVNSAHATDYSVETSELKAALANLTVDKSYKYCVAGTLTCRDMVLLKDKTTGVATDAVMYDNFVSSERAVASTGYFLKNADGTYRSRMDKVFDGQVTVDFVEPLNQNITVTFDAAGFPTFHNVTLKRLGTTRKIIATMSYNATESVITGTEYDEADPAFSQATSTTYVRIQ